MFQKLIFNNFPTIKRCSRAYSVLENNIEPQKMKHPYRITLKKADVIQYLSKNILYDKDDIVVFNKPPGLGKSRPKNESYSSIDDFYMDEILHQVPVLTICQQASIAKFPEKYSSGVMIISRSEEAAKKLAKCKLRTKHNNEDSDTYMVISLGKPIFQRNICKLALKLSEGPSKKRVPVLEDQWSQQEMKLQKVKLIRIQHEIVSTSSLASLTRVSLSTGKSNALRLYFATKLLSPVLGDSIFSGRVKGVFGVPMLIDPFSDVANLPQKLSKEVLSALSVSQNDSALVPLFVHLEQVRLPLFNRNNDLILRAPPPDIFTWTCSQLQLYDQTLRIEQPTKAPINNYQDEKQSSNVV